MKRPRNPHLLMSHEYEAKVFYQYKDPKQTLLARMTNWQRNQAGRACKGAFRKLTTEQLLHFATMPHWKSIIK